MNRNQILRLLLVVANIAVVTKTYLFWHDGPWEIPQSVHAAKRDASAVALEQKQPLPIQLAMSTKNIIDNDLFDPERGASKTKENEVIALARQKVESMILTGTMILGESRYAIFQDGSDSRSSNPNSKTSESPNIRLKLGDTVEAFKLSQIEDRKVAFTNGTTNVEIALDYFRKIDGIRVQAGLPQVASPQALSQVPLTVPRRDRLPPPPRR